MAHKHKARGTPGAPPGLDQTQKIKREEIESTHESQQKFQQHHLKMKKGDKNNLSTIDILMGSRCGHHH